MRDPEMVRRALDLRLAGKSLLDIGEAMGVTKQYVLQLLDRAEEVATPEEMAALPRRVHSESHPEKPGQFRSVRLTDDAWEWLKSHGGAQWVEEAVRKTQQT